eukprot:scaffold9731_cov39-Prasinocladus_malaysianus.AAC.1
MQQGGTDGALEMMQRRASSLILGNDCWLRKQRQSRSRMNEIEETNSQGVSPILNNAGSGPSASAIGMSPN